MLFLNNKNIKQDFLIVLNQSDRLAYSSSVTLRETTICVHIKGLVRVIIPASCLDEKFQTKQQIKF